MPAPYSDNLYSADTFSDEENEQHYPQEHHGDGGQQFAQDDDADALSPTDGYFHNSSSSTEDVAGQQQQPLSRADPSHPQAPQHHRPASSNVPNVPNVLVEDPTLRGQNASAKAREAEQERLLNNPDHSSSQHTSYPQTTPSHQHSSTVNSSVASPTSPQQRSSSSSFSNSHHAHRRSVEDEEVPQQTRMGTPPRQQQQLDAPPAYSPASPSVQQAQPTYQTFPPTPVDAAMGVPDEQARLLPRQPESMGGPPDGSKPPFGQRVKSWWLFKNFRSRLRTFLGALLIISIFLMVFSSFTLYPNHDHSDIIDDEPVKSPKMGNSDLEWRGSSMCLNEPHKFAKKTISFGFGLDHNLSFTQTIQKRDGEYHGWEPRVSGEVRVRPSMDSSPGKIELEVISNHEDLVVEVDWDNDSRTYTITTPRRLEWWTASLSPCIQIRGTIWVPKGEVLNSISVKTVQLDINVAEGLVMGVDKTATFGAVSGDVTFPTLTKSETDVVPYTLNSREIYIETISGDILGWFPLYDLLKAHSASGDITLDIEPKAAHGDKPKAAVLDLDTISGTIKAVEPLDRAIKAEKPEKKFQPREYEVSLNTKSGDITAELAFSSKAVVESISGDLKLRLWPVLDSRLLAYRGVKPYLSTDTKSGDQQVNLLEPLWTSLVLEDPATPGRVPPTPPTPPTPHHGGDNMDWAPADDEDPYLIIRPDNGHVPEKIPALGDLPPRAESSEPHDMIIADTPPLSCLKSNHQSISGEITLVYPSTWEGYMSGNTVSGDLKARGEGLQVNKSKGSFPRYMSGHKGKGGGSELKIETISGDQDLLVGKEVKE